MVWSDKAICCSAGRRRKVEGEARGGYSGGVENSFSLGCGGSGYSGTLPLALRPGNVFLLHFLG